MSEPGILRQLCTPEAASFEATCRVKDAWETIFQLIEISPDRELLEEKLHGEAELPLDGGQVTGDPSLSGTRIFRGWAARLSASEAMRRMHAAGEFAVRVFDGQRYWRLPPEAFETPFLRTIDDSWNDPWPTGKLKPAAVPEEFGPVAALGYPLLMTEAEAQLLPDVFQRLIESLIDPGGSPEPADEPDWRRQPGEARIRWMRRSADEAKRRAADRGKAGNYTEIAREYLAMDIKSGFSSGPDVESYGRDMRKLRDLFPKVA